MKRNSVEVNCNNNDDNKYTAILHERKKSAVKEVTKFEPVDVIHGFDTAQHAIQIICDKNNLLSPWDITELKKVAKQLNNISRNKIKCSSS